MTRAVAAQHHPGHPRPGLGVRARRAARTTAALAALLAATAGPPTLLWLLVGDPLHVPAPVRTLQILQAPLSDEVLLWLLATLGWLLWLHLLGSTIIELCRQTRGSTWRMPLPGLLFGANTALASHLIATLLLATHPTAPPTGAGGGLLTAARTATVAAATRGPDPARSLQIQHPTALLTGTDLITDVAADPARTATVRTAPTRTATARTIQCRVLPPTGRHHDTLWGIAARHLGDGLRWREIYTLNQNRLMPDGQRLTHASLIRPGWILHLPADAIALPTDQVLTHPEADPTDPGPAGSTAAQPDQHAHAAHPTAHHNVTATPTLPTGSATTRTTTAAPTRQVPVPARAPQPGESDHTAPAPTAVVSPAAADPGTAPRGSDRDQPSAAAPATTAPTDPSSGSELVPAAMAGLTLAAIALLTALTRRRKIAARRRPPGARSGTPPAELTKTEAELRRTARAAADVAATVRLALLLASRQATHTTVKAVWQHPDGSLELVLAHPGTPQSSTPQYGTSQYGNGQPGPVWAGAARPLPAPFEPTSRGWLLPASGLRFLFATSRSKPVGQRLADELEQDVDPFPLLVPVGSQNGSACYVNLETFGLVSLLAAEVTAGPERSGATATPAVTPVAEQGPDAASELLAGDVLRALVLALAGAPWAELTQLAVASRFAELAIGVDRIEVLHPELLTRLVADASIPALANTVIVDGRTDRALADYPSLATARRADPNGAGIIGTVVLAGLTPEQAPAPLLTAATRPTAPVVMLLLGAHPDAHPSARAAATAGLLG